jgi:uncharacterized membrane protein
MDYKFLLISLKNILLDPLKTWETIDTENRSIKVIRNSYLIPLLLLVALASIAGSLLFMNTELSPVYSILEGIKTFLSLFITVYLSALIFKEITYPLDLGRDFKVSFRIITFSLTPLFLTMFVSSLFESLLFVNILALYGLYILWTGAEKLLSPPQHKKMPLVIASFITIAGIYSITVIILNMLFERVFYAFLI